MNPEDTLFDLYLHNVDQYLSKQGTLGNEDVMRTVEDAIDISEQGADDFRRQVMSQVGQFYLANKPITLDMNPHLKLAVKKVLGQDRAYKLAIARAYLSTQE